MEEMMKERPILFNTEMVRAIIEGRKTVTRRPIKYPEQWMIEDIDGVAMYEDQWGDHYRVEELPCPLGSAGDHLYVRETWAEVGTCDPGFLTYHATYPNDLPAGIENVPDISKVRWSPSIHMPKRHARIWLKITDIRVERVQEITETQADKEGMIKRTIMFRFRDRFAATWDSIYGTWDVNPWVWVIGFERI